MANLRNELENVFGYKKYQSVLQEKACNIIHNEKRDVFICSLKNEEKPLCIQLPSTIATSKFAVVVTPTRAFIKSQVDYLKSKNISAFYWDACSSTRVKVYIKNQMEADNPNIKLLYLTYHQALDSVVQFKLFQARHNISKIIIDEADILSPLKSKFKERYLYLGNLRRRLSRIPVVAFISTDEEEIREHIMQALRVDSPVILHSKGLIEPEIDIRKNLLFQVLFQVSDTSNIWNRLNVEYNFPTASCKSITYTDNPDKLVKFIGKKNSSASKSQEESRIKSKVNAVQILKRIKEIMSNDTHGDNEGDDGSCPCLKKRAYI